MPTFFDSTADAAEASEALRGLAHASRGFDQPAAMYGVIGDLSSGMRSLRQAEPVLFWPVLSATARSAIVTSSVSPER